jgi:hypothetical protein
LGFVSDHVVAGGPGHPDKIGGDARGRLKLGLNRLDRDQDVGID